MADGSGIGLVRFAGVGIPGRRNRALTVALSP